MWAGSYVYSDGRWRIGLCADDQELIDAIVRSVPGSVTETEDPPPGYSLIAHPGLLPPAGGPGSPRELASLRRGSTTLLRSRDPVRLARSLALHLRSHPAATDQRVRLRSAAVVRDDSVVLVPAEVLWQAGLESRLARAGIAPVDSPVIEIDAVERGKGFAWIPRAWPGGGTPPGAVDVDQQRLPIRRWLLDPVGFDAHDIGSASGLVAAACTRIDPGSGAHPHDALEAVAHLRTVVMPLPLQLTASDTMAVISQALET
ncbi:hypothetical protein [Ilumatobacter nonamiensis]|uniref:hypothetical protein n=1 Tax=Ilumatobacter nonamiensis TaxID=467093 RepID=UPI000347E8D1|nr:hypothetical protein [Ilumatobacter nonamiensis]